MIKFHPTFTQLINLADGELPAAESLLMSAHCDMCEECRNKIALFTEHLAGRLFEVDDTPADSNEREYIAMFEQITNRERKVVNKQASYNANGQSSIELEGRTFRLPSTLARLSGRLGNWSHLVGKLWQAQVDIGGGYLAQFIYMEKGGSVPEHTHKGSEMTLVLDGEFADGINVYRNGDFVSLNHNHTHAPVSNADEGCLVFSIIDQPLYFTSGWAKLINPLSSLYYKMYSQT